ncbi:MAG TPA: GDYXXLXY domain-containing protein [Anaerohalosphaeraceae bacterium]|jgi:uncharacterized membrane-anchored protein|nr:GDYXXLXY domain-containing protein [Anaerohalosphaeraceae bacterium]HRT50265.1 GDYXXLXY domain-containing protein [Anaerohalosphaeraceae bacterium]HRT86214.1 GDYXXLXY domain-containing protein [Anaerohalosphaeraceae bacterium]
MSKQIMLFLTALAVQAAILAAVPGRQVYTRFTGQTIRIRTVPVDPYNLLSGYHVTLDYEISRPADWHDRRFRPDQYLYVVLKPDANGIWSVTAVHPERPKDVEAGTVVLKGRNQRHRGIVYGIESYYIPEDKRGAIERDLRQNAGKAVVEAKVDSFGNAALVRIIIDDRVYEY